MPRTLDSILANHQVAQERRDAGRRIWDRRLEIKYLLSTDSSDEKAAAAAREIGEILSSSAWCAEDQKTYGEGSEVHALAQKLSRARTIRRLNELLDELYDLADADRVWIY